MLTLKQIGEVLGRLSDDEGLPEHDRAALVDAETVLRNCWDLVKGGESATWLALCNAIEAAADTIEGTK